MSFSGVREFARQWLLLNRREEFVPGTGQHKLWLSVGGSAGFSGSWAVDIDEGQVRHDFSGRHWKVTIRSPSQEHEEVKLRKVVNKQDKDGQDRTSILNHLKKKKAPQTQTDICGGTSIPKARVKAALEYLVRERQINEAPVTKPCGTGTKRHEGFQISKQAKNGK